jgi:carboxyl-terminal processing protease
MRVQPGLAVVLSLAASAVVGGWLGPRVATAQDPVADRYRVYTAALAAIERQYVEPVESDQLVYGSINGMLQTLDPHSSFMDPRSYKQMRERQEGRYFGLGITIQAVPDGITAVRVFEGSPAHAKGIRRGDVIAEIEGQSTRGWSSDDAVGKLRGPKGTFVNIGIRRKGLDELIPMAVMRDQVSIPSLSAVFMIDDETSYVGITDFAERTDEDLGTALESLTRKGMKRLVLDLRSNPGGQLDQAIRISNRFLPKGAMVVYTRGRVANSDEDYRATDDPGYATLPMVTLVNRSSASASEIVSGALQDHDRALIVGETTFGKALVQSVFRVSGGAGLALTTARYYTPSGRLIQRPWDGTFDEYLTYTMKDQSERAKSPDQLKYTVGGRKVYSGGGVDPDERFEGPTEGFNPTRFGRSLFNRGLFAAFAEPYFYENDTRPGSKSPSFKYVKRGFEVDDAMVAAFRTFAVSRNTVIDEEAWSKDLPFIRAMIRFEIDQAVFDIATARQRLIQADPQAGYALGRFAEAERLLAQSQSRSGRIGQ